MFVNQSSASAILVVALHKHGTGAERLLDAVVGGAVAGLIGVLMFPAEPLALMRKAEREVLRSLAGALGRVAELMRAGSAGEAEWTLAAAADVHRQLAALGDRAEAPRGRTCGSRPRRWRLRRSGGQRGRADRATRPARQRSAQPVPGLCGLTRGGRRGARRVCARASLSWLRSWRCCRAPHSRGRRRCARRWLRASTRRSAR